MPSVFVPPTLTYIFVSEMPVLLEGSILKNLLLGAKQVLLNPKPQTLNSQEAALGR